jgi:UDP-N-acetylglucosamine 4,6-dehydratase
VVKVAITGGAGFLGKELTRQLLNDKSIEAIRVISTDEFKHAEMEREFNDDRVGFLIRDVRDYEGMGWALRGVDRIYHCAALKRVEKGCDVQEFLLTNVVGTRNICLAAERNQCERVMFISSDKAAYPANTYGKTKALAEDIVYNLNSKYANYKTRFACVRYGNVVNSTGSLIPLLKSSKGKIKITDPRMTRFWIKVEDAAKFVISCMNGMQGGEIFLPKMRAYSVEKLARIVRPNDEIEYIGMRDRGEKLHEILLTPEEVRVTRDYGDKYIIGSNHFGGEQLPEDFRYSSDTVKQFTDEEMIDIVFGL